MDGLKPREVVRIDRDYSSGELCQLWSGFPPELEGRVSLAVLLGRCPLPSVCSCSYLCRPDNSDAASLDYEYTQRSLGIGTRSVQIYIRQLPLDPHTISI
jgi:hypothetical protein